MVLVRQPDTRLRDLAQGLQVTERTASAIIADLTEGGYLAKQRYVGDQHDARRNHYDVDCSVPLRDAMLRHRTVGEFLAFVDDHAPATRQR